MLMIFVPIFAHSAFWNSIRIRNWSYPDGTAYDGFSGRFPASYRFAPAGQTPVDQIRNGLDSSRDLKSSHVNDLQLVRQPFFRAFSQTQNAQE